MNAFPRDLARNPLIQSVALHLGLVILLWLFAHRMTPDIPEPAVLQTRMVSAASLHGGHVQPAPVVTPVPTPTQPAPEPVKPPVKPVEKPAHVDKPRPVEKTAPPKSKPVEPERKVVPAKPVRKQEPAPKPLPEKPHPVEKAKPAVAEKAKPVVKDKAPVIEKAKATPAEKTHPPVETPKTKPHDKPLPKEEEKPTPAIAKSSEKAPPKDKEPPKPVVKDTPALEKKPEPKKLSLKSDLSAFDSEISTVKDQISKDQKERLALAAQQAAKAEADRLTLQQKADADRLAAQQKSAQNDAAIKKFTQLIRDRVEKKWDIPPGIVKNTSAQVRISLLPGGEVVNVLIIKSSGNHAFDESIKNAIYRASPLPVPDDMALFNQQFRVLPMEFKKED